MLYPLSICSRFIPSNGTQWEVRGQMQRATPLAIGADATENKAVVNYST
jgi:hypothetical protein